MESNCSVLELGKELQKALSADSPDSWSSAPSQLTHFHGKLKIVEENNFEGQEEC